MKKEQILLFLLAGINFTNIMDVMIIMPLGNQLMNMFDINPQQFSFIVASYNISAFASGLVAAVFIDRFDRKKALLLVYSGFTFGTIACAMAPSYLFLLLARSITGMFGGIIGAMVLSIVSDVFSYEKRGKAMGILTSAFSAASVLGVPFGLFMASRYSWHAPFWVIGGLGMILLSLLSYHMPAMDQHVGDKSARKNPIQVFKRIGGDTNQLLALGLTFIMVLGHFMVIPFIAPYMERNVGFTEDQVTLIYLIGGGFTIFSAPFIGRITDRKGALKVFTALLIISFVPILMLTHLGAIHIALALAVTSLFFVFGSGRMIPAQTMITAAVNTEQRGSFMSVRSSVLQLAAGLASFMGGFIVVEQAGGFLGQYNILGYLSIGISALTLLLAPRLKIIKD